jgi:hypothetical protein
VKSDACFFDNAVAGYERVKRKCRLCGSYEHDIRGHARLTQAKAA